MGRFAHPHPHPPSRNGRVREQDVRYGSTATGDEGRGGGRGGTEVYVYCASSCNTLCCALPLSLSPGMRAGDRGCVYVEGWWWWGGLVCLVNLLGMMRSTDSEVAFPGRGEGGQVLLPLTQKHNSFWRTERRRGKERERMIFSLSLSLSFLFLGPAPLRGRSCVLREGGGRGERDEREREREGERRAGRS